MNGKGQPVPQVPSRLGSLAVWVVVIATLYFARDFLIPIAVAVLIAFLLAPIVNRLEGWRLGRIPSVIIVLLLVLGIVGGIGYVVANQFVDLAGQLPSYKQTLVQKARNLRPSGDGTLFKAREALEDLGREVTEGATTSTAQTTTAPEQLATAAKDRHSTGTSATTGSALRKDGATRSTSQEQSAVPVKIVQDGTSTAWQGIRSLLGPIFSWLGTVGLIMLFVLFMLLQRDDLRDRIIRLSGKHRVKVTTEALDDAGSRVSRYLLMQLIVNVTYGVPVAIGLYFIGLPNAVLWGVLAMILRFIPYLGPWIAATIPILLSVAVFDDWTHTFFTIGLYVVMELISNNFMEPLLYGHTTGISPVAIIVSAVFWTWLWGGVGLLLATPITVCLVVMGRHIPSLGVLSVLLGDEPVLPPEARLYNRLLADDQDDALEIAEKKLEKHSLAELYDEILLPALGMAERDRHEGELSIEKQKIIWSSMSEMIESLAERADVDEAKRSASEHPDQQGEDTKARIDLARASMPRRKVLCLPARDNADELAASMLAQVLVRAHHTVRVVSVETLAGEMVDQVKEFEPDVICISALPPLATTHARYLCKRVKADVPNATVMVGLWTAEGDSSEALRRLQGSGVDIVVKSIQEAVGKI